MGRRLGRGIRQAPTTWFGASTGAEDIIPFIITQTGVVYDPVVDAAPVQNLDAAFIDQTGAIFALVGLGISTDVSPEFISNPGTAYSPVVGTHILHPISVITEGGWTDQDGGTTDLYGVVDEFVVDNTDYVKSPYAAGPSTLELKFNPGATPPTLSGHVLRYYYAKDTPAERLSLTVRLMQGATVIASWVHTDLEHSFILVEQEVTPAQASAITDYSDLRVQFETLDI